GRRRGDAMVRVGQSPRLGRGVLVVSLLVSAQVAALSMASATRPDDPSRIGAWSAPFQLPVKAIHSTVLPGGLVLLYSYPVHELGSDVWLWDPATGSTTNVSLQWPRDIFCSGQSLLADGRVFVTGGHVHG